MAALRRERLLPYEPSTYSTRIEVEPEYVTPSSRLVRTTNTARSAVVSRPTISDGDDVLALPPAAARRGCQVVWPVRCQVVPLDRFFWRVLASARLPPESRVLSAARPRPRRRDGALSREDDERWRRGSCRL